MANKKCVVKWSKDIVNCVKCRIKLIPYCEGYILDSKMRPWCRDCIIETLGKLEAELE